VKVASPLAKSGLVALATAAVTCTVAGAEAAAAGASAAVAYMGKTTAVAAISNWAINFMVLLSIWWAKQPPFYNAAWLSRLNQ
jgi:hypothetical protein